MENVNAEGINVCTSYKHFPRMETVNPKDSRKMNVVHFAHEIFDFVASVEFPAEILTARGLGFAKTLAP